MSWRSNSFKSIPSVFTRIFVAEPKFGRYVTLNYFMKQWTQLLALTFDAALAHNHLTDELVMKHGSFI